MASFSDIISSIWSVIASITPKAGRGCSITQDATGCRIDIDEQDKLEPYVAIKITSDKDVNNLYTGDVYADGTQVTATQTSVKIGLLNENVDTTDVQGFYLAHKSIVLISGVATEVYEIIPGIPLILDTTNPYFLMCIAGKVKWVRAGDCTGSSV